MSGTAHTRHLGLRAGRGVPLPVQGPIRRAKSALAVLLMAAFAGTPWLR